MNIFVDADAIPQIAKELIIKAACRTQTMAIFVANYAIKLPPSPYLHRIVVTSGFDAADDYIIHHTHKADLVITSDIPLANEVLQRGALVLTARGEQWTPENIKPKLNARDFMESLRGTNVLDAKQMGGQKPYGDKDKIAFANGLNRLIKPLKT